MKRDSRQRCDLKNAVELIADSRGCESEQTSDQMTTESRGKRKSKEGICTIKLIVECLEMRDR